MSEHEVSRALPVSAAAIRLAQKEVAEDNAIQVESLEDLNQYFELAAFNPMRRASQFKELTELRSPPSSKKEKTSEAAEVKPDIEEQFAEAASRYQKGNFELNETTLLILRQRLKGQDPPEDLLKQISEVYGDASLVDEALDFLIETADPDTVANFKKAKQLLNEQAPREIKAGKNMGAIAREFSKEGLATPVSLRDMYKDITGTAREPLALFNELTEKFRYEKMKTAIDFLLHSLGRDLRAKGPSIPRQELRRLIDDVRSLQGILGVFRFFQSRMPLIERQFMARHLLLPIELNFETLAKLFVKLLAEKFINGEKILQTARLLNILNQLGAQVILYAQMRDGLKQISPRYYRNPLHKDELWNAYLDAIETLEDRIEEEEEKQEEEEKKKKQEEKENR